MVSNIIKSNNSLHSVSVITIQVLDFLLEVEVLHLVALYANRLQSSIIKLGLPTTVGGRNDRKVPICLIHNLNRQFTN